MSDKSKSPIRTIAIIGLILWPFQATPGKTEVEEVIFSWQTDRCERWDIPDTPARAWRDHLGVIHLLAGAEASRAGVGDGLGQLTQDCRILLQGAQNPDPAQRNDRLWLASVFTRNGLDIAALVHAEYHGHAHPGACHYDQYILCWRNAILSASSSDGGFQFQMDAVPPIAVLPYPYDPAQSRRSGYFSPSNMIVHDNALYVFIFAEAYRAQRRGLCLLRRPMDGGPGDWRAWDGRAFTVQFADPYLRKIQNPADHVCAPLPGLTANLTSVVRQNSRFLAVSPAVHTDPDGYKIPGFWGHISTDLVNWGPPILLESMSLYWRRDCGGTYANAYPAFLDPDSPSQTFETVGDIFWLTHVRARVEPDCRLGPERDLVRRQIVWPAGSSSPVDPRQRE